MTRAVVLGVMVLCTAVPAAAQTKGRVSVGGSVTFVQPTDSDVKSLVAVGPLVRLNPKKGWGPAAGFSWFRADLDNPSGASGDFATLTVRPLMGGIAYTIGEQPVLISFSIVAGPSFNSIKLDDDFVRALPPIGGTPPTVDIGTSFVVRPGVGLTWTVAPRVGILGFAGYSFNRPDVTYRDFTGQEFHNRWKADALLFSVGAVYSLF
jgi:Outer membrane protein beta-barrel domain